VSIVCPPLVSSPNLNTPIVQWLGCPGVTQMARPRCRAMICHRRQNCAVAPAWPWCSRAKLTLRARLRHLRRAGDHRDVAGGAARGPAVRRLPALRVATLLAARPRDRPPTFEAASAVDRASPRFAKELPPAPPPRGHCRQSRLPPPRAPVPPAHWSNPRSET